MILLHTVIKLKLWQTSPSKFSQQIAIAEILENSNPTKQRDFFLVHFWTRVDYAESLELSSAAMPRLELKCNDVSSREIYFEMKKKLPVCGKESINI